MTENGKYTHSQFVDVNTDKPLFVHRIGSNVKYGYYYVDSSDKELLEHYRGKTNIDIEHYAPALMNTRCLSSKFIV